MVALGCAGFIAEDPDILLPAVSVLGHALMHLPDVTECSNHAACYSYFFATAVRQFTLSYGKLAG